MEKINLTANGPTGWRVCRRLVAFLAHYQKLRVRLFYLDCEIRAAGCSDSILAAPSQTDFIRTYLLSTRVDHSNCSARWLGEKIYLGRFGARVYRVRISYNGQPGWIGPV